LIQIWDSLARTPNLCFKCQDQSKYPIDTK
ncbi:unnamed protein product, partial [Rotaria sp. Silwood1]